MVRCALAANSLAVVACGRGTTTRAFADPGVMGSGVTALAHTEII